MTTTKPCEMWKDASLTNVCNTMRVAWEADNHKHIASFRPPVESLKAQVPSQRLHFPDSWPRTPGGQGPYTIRESRDVLVKLWAERGTTQDHRGVAPSWGIERHHWSCRISIILLGMESWPLGPGAALEWVGNDCLCGGAAVCGGILPGRSLGEWGAGRERNFASDWHQGEYRHHVCLEVMDEEPVPWTEGVRCVCCIWMNVLNFYHRSALLSAYYFSLIDSSSPSSRIIHSSLSLKAELRSIHPGFTGCCRLISWFACLFNWLASWLSSQTLDHLCGFPLFSEPHFWLVLWSHQTPVSSAAHHCCGILFLNLNEFKSLRIY